MAYTKEELLEKLSYLPTDTLDKLFNYSQNILIPEEDLLVDVTMQQMMQKSFELADTYFPEWTDRSIADFGRFLVELFAVFSEKDFYYINGYANENLLAKMSIYSDAFMRSVELGYYPNVCRSSKATFKLEFAASVAAFTLPRGSVIIDVVGTPYSFTNLLPIAVPASPTTNSFVTVELNEGKIITETFQFNGFSVYVSKSGIDTESLVTTIGEATWTRVRTFGQASATSKHYVAIPEDDGSIRVFFGDEGYGKRPEPNEGITISYLRCAGTLADGLSGSATINSYPNEVDMMSVALLGSTTSGQDPDTLADLKNKARNYFFNNQTLNNQFVVKSWLLSQYEVKKAYVKIVNNQVYFKVVPAITTSTEATIIALLGERMQPIITGGYFAQPEVTDYVPVNTVELQVFFLQGFNTSINVEKVRNLVSDYTNPYTLSNYGRGFNKSELEILLKSKVEGLQNVIFISINGSLADVPVAANQILRKVPDTGITVIPYEV